MGRSFPTIFATSMQAPEGAILGLLLISIVTLILITLIVLRVRSLDVKLILLGLVMALAAVNLSVHEREGGVSVQAGVSSGSGVGVQHAGVSVATGIAAGLMKIGLILVLGGVAVSLLTRWGPAPPADSREDVPHVP